MENRKKESNKKGMFSKQSAGKTGDRKKQKSVGRTADRKEQKSVGRTADRKGQKPVGKTADRTMQKPVAKSTAKVTNNQAVKSGCPYMKKCGGCQNQGIPYDKQLKKKQKMMEELLSPVCDKIYPIIGMKEPLHYRNKVSAAFGRLRNGTYISGVYEADSHRIVPIESCLIEDQKADEIIGTIRGMLKSFKIRTYDEDTGYGLLRHVLVRVGKTSGQIMVVLVTASPVFPSKNNFVKALREKHPEITTIVQNVNNRNTSMVLGNKETNLYGRGYIEDQLCGYTFKISAQSFYQINPVQTELLYKKAIDLAKLTGKERIVDAYCGIGTIGLIASKHVKAVISVELNKDAVRDAIYNAKRNDVKNIAFYQADAGKFMTQMAAQDAYADVVFMDPPRSGSDEAFLSAVVTLSPRKIVYISCGPETLARDLNYLKKHGYQAKEAWPVDMFPATVHCESIVALKRTH